MKAGLGLLGALLAAVALAPSATASTAGAAVERGGKKCGSLKVDGFSNRFPVTAKRVSCDKARNAMKVFLNGDNPKGWSCSPGEPAVCKQKKGDGRASVPGYYGPDDRVAPRGADARSPARAVPYSERVPSYVDAALKWRILEKLDSVYPPDDFRYPEQTRFKGAVGNALYQHTALDHPKWAKRHKNIYHRLNYWLARSPNGSAAYARWLVDGRVQEIYGNTIWNMAYMWAYNQNIVHAFHKAQECYAGYAVVGMQNARSISPVLTIVKELVSGKVEQSCPYPWAI